MKSDTPIKAGSKEQQQASIAAMQDKLKASAFANKQDEESKQSELKDVLNSTNKLQSRSTPDLTGKIKTSFTDEDLRQRQEGDDPDPLEYAETTRTSESPFDPYEVTELETPEEEAQTFLANKIDQNRQAQVTPSAPAQQTSARYSDVDDAVASQGGYSAQINPNQPAGVTSASFNPSGGVATPQSTNTFNKPASKPNQASGMNPFHNRQEFDNTTGNVQSPYSDNRNFIDNYNQQSIIEPDRNNFLPPGFNSNVPTTQTLLKSNDAGFGPMSANKIQSRVLPTKPTLDRKGLAQAFSNQAVSSVMKGNFTKE